MTRIAATALVGVLLVSRGSSVRGLWPLGPGEYVLQIAAREGSMAGNTAGGRLWLLATSLTDRSVRTGRIADANRSDPRYIPLYGWTEVDLGRVGAPLCSDGPAPAPTSRDPVFPGVLVLTVDPAWAFEANGVVRPKDGPMLVLGTLSNMRDGAGRLDGCGIGLFAQSIGRNCIRGAWAEWGIVADGRGRFELCR